MENGDRTISPRELTALMEEGRPMTLLDVRRQADYERDPAMIPRAVKRDPEQIEQWSQELPEGQEVVIYCVRGGSVSNAVLDQLLARNIRARFIEGGIAAWKESGGTVT
jgi:rhodanese-related sulfurtransferase